MRLIIEARLEAPQSPPGTAAATVVAIVEREDQSLKNLGSLGLFVGAFGKLLDGAD